MKLIGLTGNIASGKSTVARILVELGAAHIDADALVHELYEPDTSVTRAIAERFGQAILAPDGSIDRRALGAIVFNDPDALRELELIVHPESGRAVAERLALYAAESPPPPAVVIEAVKLIEVGRHKLVDSLWFVIAKPEIQKARLMSRRGLSDEEAQARVAAQASLEERLHHADVILENSGSVETLRRQVLDAWHDLTVASQDGEASRA